jgi:hypothetical protein
MEKKREPVPYSVKTMHPGTITLLTSERYFLNTVPEDAHRHFVHSHRKHLNGYIRT